MADLTRLLDAWRGELAAWAIPGTSARRSPSPPGCSRGRCSPGAPADVVTCHHVLYNVPDLAPFVTALTSHARRLVVTEMTATHPLATLNELWLKFHGLRRPDGPTAAGLLRILAAMGLRPGCRRWRRPGGADYTSFDELTDVTRRRLCLPPERAGEAADALVEAGIDPGHPADLGSSGRDVVTIWWAGGAGQDPTRVRGTS